MHDHTTTSTDQPQGTVIHMEGGNTKGKSHLKDHISRQPHILPLSITDIYTIYSLLLIQRHQAGQAKDNEQERQAIDIKINAVRNVLDNVLDALCKSIISDSGPVSPQGEESG
jgi:hypothetical protein